MRAFFFMLAMVWLGQNFLHAEDIKTKNWELITRLKRYHFEDKHPHRNDNVTGQSSQVGVGYSYYGHSLRAGIAGGFLLGPYEQAEQNSIQVDLSGTSIELYVNYLLLGKRGSEHAWGIGSSTAYSDLVGRAKTGRKADDPSIRFSDYATRLRLYSSTFEVNLSFLREPRPLGNQPNDLVTRLEGSMFSIGIEYPWRIDYKTTYVLDGPQIGNQVISKEGRMQGMAIYGGISLILGI
jgi:hypothetical protein